MQAESPAVDVGRRSGDAAAHPGRVEAARGAERVAWAAFTTLLVVSPFRAHLVLAERPVPPVYHAYTNVVVTWSEIAVAVTLVAWLVAVGLRPRRVAFGPAAVRVPWLVVLALAWATAPFAADPALAVSNALGLTLAGGLAVFVVNAVRSLDRLAPAFVVLLVVHGAIAAAQVATQGSVGLGALGERAVTPATAGASVVAAADGTRFLRGYGLADHPNILGGVAVAAGLLVVLAGRLRQVALATIAAWTAVAVLLTFSRSAWLAGVIGVFIASGALLATRDRTGMVRLARAGALAAACLAIAALPLSPYLATRLEPGRADVPLEARSVDERAALTAATVSVVADHPLTGVGAGGLPVALRDADPDFAFSYQPAHLVPLTVAAELGVAGGVAWVAGAAAPWFLLARSRRRWTAELSAASAVLAALTVVALLDYYSWTFPAGRIWWWLAIGLWVVAWRNAHEAPTGSPRTAGA